MFVSIPLIALALSLATLTATVISWFAARQARKARALTETVPQLAAVVFGPADLLGRVKREEGLEVRVQELERTVKDHQRYARSNRRRIERTQAVVLEIVSVPIGESSRPLDTGQYRAISARFQDLDEPGDSEPPTSDE